MWNPFKAVTRRPNKEAGTSYPSWIPVSVVIGLIVVSGPWFLLLVSQVRARDIALVAHYQALILALIALAAAVMGLISYLTVEQRVQDRMTSYYQTIKAQNRTRIRELLTLERIREKGWDTSAFEEFVDATLNDVERWEFFRDDIEDVYMMMVDMSEMSSLSVKILRFAQRHPEVDINDHWRFYLTVMSETPTFMSEALSLIKVLRAPSDRTWFVEEISRMTMQWRQLTEERKTVLSQLIPSLRQQLIDTDSDIIRALEDTIASADGLVEGKMTLTVHDPSGEPSIMDWQYFDALAREGLENDQTQEWASSIHISGKTVRQVIAEDVRYWLGDVMFQRLKDHWPNSRVTIIVDPLEYENLSSVPEHLLYGWVVKEPGRSYYRYPQHTLEMFVHQFEALKQVNVMKVEAPAWLILPKIPRREFGLGAM